MRIAIIGVLAAVTLTGCVTSRPNPQRKACTDRCVESKNRCLLEATSADAVGQCDALHRACAEPCLAMPLRVP